MKILLVATVQSHICQFHRPLVQMLHDHGCTVHVAARDNLAEKNGLKLDFADEVHDIPFARSPLSRSNIYAFRQLKSVIKQENYDVVHCNTPVGGILARLAAKSARKRGCKVIYTAHGFHFFKGGPRKSWILYYPIEKLMCRYTDLLVTINDEDYALAKKCFSVRTKHIRGVGANSEKYGPISAEDQAVLKEHLGCGNHTILLCTGELNVNKNQLVAIQAMQGVVKHHPDVKLLLAGNGPLEERLDEEIRQLGMSDHVQLLGYRTNLQDYVRAADLIVSCSKREGLPLNIIEGMLCEKAVVASVNRGHKELIEEGVTGYLLPADDPTAFGTTITSLLDEPSRIREMGKAGMERAQIYTDKAVYRELEELYGELGVI